MRVLIFTSSCGTAHDAAAYALRDWLARGAVDVEVRVEHALENASSITHFFVAVYNWIQTHAPWLQQLYWRIIEWEDLVKPGTVLVGRRYLIRLLRSYRPQLLISTYPHTNRGHFDLAKRIVGQQLRCITCCTELDGGFGFTRNWVSRTADAIWTLTPEASAELRRRGYPAARIWPLGPLLYPDFATGDAAVVDPSGLPLLVLGTGGNGANNHLQLLRQLLPLAGRLRLVALCGRRGAAFQAVQAWARTHPALAVEARDFQGPQAMGDLYRQAWAFVSRPGARTATEALVTSCPLIFNHYGFTMPQELLAVRYFQAHGLETSIHRPRHLATVVSRWLDQPETYRQLKARYQAARLQSDPPAILQALLHG